MTTQTIEAVATDSLHLELFRPLPHETDEIVIKIRKKPESIVSNMLGLCHLSNEKEIDFLIENEEWF